MKENLAEFKTVKEIEALILAEETPLKAAQAIARWHQERLERTIYLELRQDFVDFDKGDL